MATARRVAAKLDRFASGAYVNALSDEGASGVRRAYSPAKLARQFDLVQATQLASGDVVLTYRVA